MDLQNYTLRYLWLFFTACCLLAGPARGQYEQVWAFGQHAGLDFNSGQARPIRTAMQGFGEGNASVCNKEGQLQFYTEGTVVWNRNGDVMSGGENLVPFETNNDFTPTSSTCQGALIMPVPASNSKYYVFSLTSIEQTTRAGRLYYSIVDMSLNNGLGAVVTNQRGILVDTNLKEQMTAVTGDRCNNWLLVRGWDNTFKAYRITDEGIDPQPSLSKLGRSGNGTFVTGQILLSPDGRKLAACYCMALFGVTGSMELFDFDRATGLVSNALMLDSTKGLYGAAFSQDNSKLYVASIESIYQFDLTVADPRKTGYRVGPSSFTQLKLGPDGKVYAKSANDYSHLSVIQTPNLAGAACGFSADAITLLPGTSISSGLPNNVAVVVHDTMPPTVQTLKAPCWFNDSTGYLMEAAPGGWDYVWEDSSTGPSRIARRAGTYYVTYFTPPCVWHRDSFVVTLPNGVLPRIQTDKSCNNTANGRAWAYTYAGDTVQYRYTWRDSRNIILSQNDSLNGVPAGAYSLHIQTHACDTTLYLHIDQVEDRVAFETDTLACITDTIRFHNTSGAYYTRFSWSFGDGAAATGANPEHHYDREGLYTVRLTGQGSQCSDTAYADIGIDAVLAASFTKAADSICIGQAIRFHLSPVDERLLTQSWLFGDGSRMDWTGGSSLDHAYDLAGPMPVTMLSRFRACPERLYTDSLFVEALPVVDLGPESALCLGATPLRLGNQAPVPAYLRYVWNTGDTTAFIQVTSAGTYRLTASTHLGCRSTESVTVSKDCYTDLPNAFTPDGDGYNDYFFPRQLLSAGLQSLTMQVFNRWGQLLFETKALDGRGWDGRYNGREQPAGTYIYRITLVFPGRQEIRQGNIMLLR